MNAFISATGTVYMQSQFIKTMPSPFTAGVVPVIVVTPQIKWQPFVVASSTPLFHSDETVKRVGKLYAELAGEDVKLAELGMADYSDLLERDLLLH